MASLDSLPADQRAVLELVLKRGRTYDEIARMLSIDRAGVRERALSAFDALGPQTRVPPERRALITDYLLGQLPAKVSEETHQRLAQSASERAWARVLASELDSIAVSPLPEIPTDGAREPEPAAVPGREPIAVSAPAAAAEPSPAATEPGASQPRGLAARPSSRRGGIILLSLGALVVVAVVVVIALLSGGGSKKNSTTSASQPAATSSTPTTSSTPSTSTSTSTTAANGAKLVAQINLTAPTSAAATKPVGVALVLKQGKNTGIAIRAQNLPANGKHDAYAVWLYKSDNDNHILGFVNPAVGSNGVLQAESALPSNAGHFSQLLITKETQQNPKSPGTIVLQGTLKGLS
jgi:Rod binding domain-containing protein